MLKPLIFASMLLAAVTLPPDKDFRGPDADKGMAACSGEISQEGILAVSRVENTQGIFLMYEAENGHVVIAIWKAGNMGQPDELALGAVKDGKIIVAARRKFNPASDSQGPCPLLLPKTA